MGVCFQPLYSGTNPQTKPWHLSPYDSSATYPKHYFFVDPYVQIIPNWFKILQDTQM